MDIWIEVGPSAASRGPITVLLIVCVGLYRVSLRPFWWGHSHHIHYRLCFIQN